MARTSKEERFVQGLFRTRYNVDLIKLPELPGGPTPDFEVKELQGRRFVAEQKTISWEERLEQNPPIAIVGGLEERWDNAPERVGDKIHKGFRQFRGYSDPKVLILLNLDNAVDLLDLLAAYRGFLVYANQVFGYINRGSARVSDGRIAPEKALIDLYVWIQHVDQSSIPKVDFLYTTEAGRSLSRFLLGEAEGVHLN